MEDEEKRPRAEDKPSFLSSAVEQERIFYKEHPTTTDGLRVICGGREKVTRNYRIDRPGFPYLGIEWVARGKGSLTLSGKVHSLQPGAFFIYGPEIAHRITTDPEARLVKYFVNFEGEDAEALLAKYDLDAPTFRLLPPSCGISEIFDRLIEGGASNMAGAPRLCKLLLECLILLAAEQHPDASTLHSRAFQTYQRCHTYMENNFRHLQRIEDVAQTCHVDPAYLTRLFKRFADATPHRCLLQMKMKAAALQLMRRDSLVKEIADEFGYTDPYHFSKSFKKIHGLSPEHYAQARRI